MVLDANGMNILLPITASPAKPLAVGADTTNGRRYRVNHSYTNYLMQGYFLNGVGQERIAMKGEGPDHLNCTNLTNLQCFWAEMSCTMDGIPELYFEVPHPTTYAIPWHALDLVQPLGSPINLRWVGYAYAGYTDQNGIRTIEQWVDKTPFHPTTGVPNNTWVLTAKLLLRPDGNFVTTEMLCAGGITPQAIATRPIPVTVGNGLDAEVRMHNAMSGDTAMKWASVYEVNPAGLGVPGGGGGGGGGVPNVDAFGTRGIYASKSGGPTWASTSWNNGIARTITTDRDVKKEWPDPHDPPVCIPAVGDAVVRILGNGEAIFDGRSPRFTVLKGWKNVESTIYFKPNNAYWDNLGLRVKTDHYCVNCGTGDNGDCFGGYAVQYHWTDNETHVRKEQTHNLGYSSRIDVRSPLPNPTTNTWIGMKGICYTMANGNVKLEQYLDYTDGASGGTWTLASSGIDSGSWKGPVNGGTHQGSAIRFNSLDETGQPNASYRCKKFSIREIVPPS